MLRHRTASSVVLGRLCLTAALLVAAPAFAVTVNINAHEVHTGGPSFWTASTSFVLPSNFKNAKLNITDFGVDDRGIVALNGTMIDSVGLFAPGLGRFTFKQSASSVPFFYAIGDGARNIDVTTGFLAGLNTLKFTINDTSSGIFGELSGGPEGEAGPTAYAFNGNLTYDVGGVPEPAIWASLVIGMLLTGGSLRRRRDAVVAA